MSNSLEPLIERVDLGDRDRRRRRREDSEEAGGDRRRRRDAAEADAEGPPRRRRRDDGAPEEEERRRRRERDVDAEPARDRRRREDPPPAPADARRRRRDDGDSRGARSGREAEARAADRARRRERSREDSLSKLRGTRPLSPPRPGGAAGGAEPGAEEKMARAIERDKRTVFVSNLHPKVDDFEIFEFFSKAGKVRDVRLICDKNGKSKGFGYVEFYDPSSVAGALNLQGMEIHGHPCLVKLSESEKNLQAAIAAQQLAAQQQSSSRLFVGNVAQELTEDDLRTVFEQLGPVDYVEMHRGDEGEASWAHVKYRSQDDAKKAVAHLNQEQIAGLRIKVGLVDEAGHGKGDDADALAQRGKLLLLERLAASGPTPPLPPGQPPPGPPPPLPPTALSGLVGRPLGIGAPALPPAGLPGVPAPVVPPPAPYVPPPDTACVYLSNLFDPAEEEDEDFDEDIKEEVADQCNKLGKLLHIFVDKHSPKGEVWLRFGDNQGGQATKAKMHDRWFAKRQIKAEFVPTATYEQRFPNSGKA